MPNTKANAYTKVADLTPEQLATRRHNDLRRQHKHRARALGMTLESYRYRLWTRQQFRLYCEECDRIRAQWTVPDGLGPKRDPRWVRFYDRRPQWSRFFDW